jgi:hypothetical protein
MLLGLLIAPSARAAEDDLDRLMALLAERVHGHVSFVEEDYLAVLERPVHSSGELFYDRPEGLKSARSRRIRRASFSITARSRLKRAGTLTCRAARLSAGGAFGREPARHSGG